MAPLSPLIAAAAASLVISVVVLTLRLWSRTVTRTPIWWDDWTALLSMIFATTTASLTFYGVSHSTPDDPSGPIYSAIGTIPFNLGTMLIKVSALFFYARIFKIITWFRWTLWATGTVCITSCVAFIFWNVFSCRPVAKFFHKSLPGTCASARPHFVTDAAVNVVLDLTILLLPLVPLWAHQGTTKQKWSATALFLGGYCILALSIYRLVASSAANIFDSPHNKSLTRSQLPYILEIPLSIVIVSLPSLRMLFVRVWRHGFFALFSRREYSVSSDQQSGSRLQGFAKSPVLSQDDRAELLLPPRATDRSRGLRDERLKSHATVSGSPQLAASDAIFRLDEYPRSA